MPWTMRPTRRRFLLKTAPETFLVGGDQATPLHLINLTTRHDQQITNLQRDSNGHAAELRYARIFAALMLIYVFTNEAIRYLA